MTVWNKLPIGGGGDLTFTTLYHTGAESGSATFSYTTTSDYAYLIVSANRAGTGQNEPQTTCSGGTLVAAYYCNLGTGSIPSRQSVKIWRDVPRGSTVTLQSYSGRKGIMVTGVSVG